MVDEFVDRLKGRRQVESDSACENVGDFFFDADGTKWLCVAADRADNRTVLDIDEIEPVLLSKLLKRVVIIFVTLASVVVPLFYWFFWRNV